MTTPKRRRRKLLLLAARFDDDALITLLSKTDPLYYITERDWDTNEQAVIDATDAYYLAYNTGDSDSFNDCGATDLSSNVKAGYHDTLASAVDIWN